MVPQWWHCAIEEGNVVPQLWVQERDTVMEHGTVVECSCMAFGGVEETPHSSWDGLQIVPEDTWGPSHRKIEALLGLTRAAAGRCQIVTETLIEMNSAGVAGLASAIALGRLGGGRRNP